MFTMGQKFKLWLKRAFESFGLRYITDVLSGTEKVSHTVKTNYIHEVLLSEWSTCL